MKRKIKYIILLFSFAASISLHAQKTKWGIKAGVNISDFNGAAFPSSTTNALVGYHAGVFYNLKLPLISIQPELLISTAGAKIVNGNLTQDFKLTYLSMPIMLQLKIFSGTYLEAGPQFSYKLNEDGGSGSIRGFINDLDLAAGGGIRFKLFFLSCYARYLAGISKVGDFNSSTAPNFKNGVLQAGLALHFKGKK